MENQLKMDQLFIQFDHLNGYYKKQYGLIVVNTYDIMHLILDKGSKRWLMK
ncbi:hypothetical protein [Alkalihalobacterium alkalinitrilicum]|uniref:hypothetical protein n=1 Tax=Alkalihalobacterium alkalinitrilicum TaxID=427920 RepID=UPI0013033E13|nr:hypothetical protein [Alkalihalobacterium alkalinitrilicum]